MKYTLATCVLLGHSAAILIRDDPICDSLGCDTDHFKDEGKEPYPVDYTVPDFGVD